MPTTASIQHAFDVLEAPAPTRLPHVIVVLGDDRFLKRLVLAHLLGSGDQAEYAQYDADEQCWTDLADELATASLLSPGPRQVFLNDADGFVSRYRSELEAYATQGSATGTLVLELQTLPSNTRLYRAVTETGWLIDCRPPEGKRANSKSPDVIRLQKWLEAWAQQRHAIKLSREAVNLLVDLVGWEWGLLDQELAKLALFVERQGRVEADLVQRVVGGWRTQTTWDMLEKAADGDAAAALLLLDQLLQAGESPQALFGSIAWSLRRFAAATRLVEQQERAGKRANLATALHQAGFRNWPQALERASMQIKQMTRQRSGQLYAWLLETDLALKGSHSAPQRARWALEYLLLRFARSTPQHAGEDRKR
jgi:DNA polymerase III subunit delta